MRTKRYLGAALTVGLLMAACATEDGVHLTAGLTGNGSATAEIKIDSESGKICWELSDFAGTIGGEVTGMHIHSAQGAGGPVVLEFLSGNACTEVGASAVTASTLWNMAEHPADFYVDVHTERYPDGAARGQLRAVSS